MTSRVETATVKAVRRLVFPSIPAGAVRSFSLGECTGVVSDAPELAPVVGARVGDLVTLGPPPLPAGLVASAVVVQPDCVEVRVFNATGAAVTPPAGDWTVAVGGGPGGGAPQVTTEASALTPPYAVRTPPAA